MLGALRCRWSYHQRYVHQASDCSCFSTALHCGLDNDDAAVDTRNCALDEQQVGIGIDLGNLQVLHGHAVVAHAACHALALEDATRGSGSADTTDATVRCLVTVCCTLAGKAVARPVAGAAVGVGCAGAAQEVALVDDLDGDALASLVAGSIRNAALGDVAARGNAGLLEVARLRLVDLTWVDLTECDLDGLAAVDVLGAHLGYDTRPSLDNGNRYDAVLVIEDLGHAELLAQDALDLNITHSFVLRCL